jgi:hypothetical protein
MKIYVNHKKYLYQPSPPVATQATPKVKFDDPHLEGEGSSWTVVPSLLLLRVVLMVKTPCLCLFSIPPPTE